MKPKTVIFFTAIVAVFILALVAYTQAPGVQNVTPTLSTSRYVLFCGTHTVKKESKEIPQVSVFRLDTYTGKTWILQVIVKEGKPVRVWIDIPENRKPAEPSSKGIRIP